MANRLEEERKKIMALDTPMSRHSMNQHQIKSYIEGQQRMARSGKEERIERRRNRQTELTESLEISRALSIFDQVMATLEGYDGSNRELFTHQLDYLSRVGIQISSPVK